MAELEDQPELLFFDTFSHDINEVSQLFTIKFLFLVIKSTLCDKKIICIDLELSFIDK